jgi:hypothetical protein
MKKRMNMGGLPSQANTMARKKAPGAMGGRGSWSPGGGAGRMERMQGRMDNMKSRMDDLPTKPAGMKAGGMVRGAGCATRGKKHSKKMG